MRRHSLKNLTFIFLIIMTFAICLSGCGKRPERGMHKGDKKEVSAKSKPPIITPEPIDDKEADVDRGPHDDHKGEHGHHEKKDRKHGKSGQRKVYLTFDDGPCEHTDKVLDILGEYGIKATFFTIGSQMVANPEPAKRTVEEGHLLACHTYYHDMGITYKDTQSFVDDINLWRKTVVDQIGYDAGAYVIRFPGGTTNTTIGGRAGRDKWVEAANNAGYKIYDWNLGINDRWLAGNTEDLPKAEYFWQSYLATYSLFADTDPLILIIHDTEPVSAEVLPMIIDDLIEKGFDFGTCDELEGDYLM